MKYSLIEGLAALASFGVVLLANNDLYRYVRRFLLPKNSKIGIDTAFFHLVPSLGLAYLAGILGRIVIKSDILLDLDKLLMLAVVLGLSMPFLVTFHRLFSDIISALSEKRGSLFKRAMFAVWGGLFVGFVVSSWYIWYGLAMFIFIFLLPPISKYVR